MKRSWLAIALLLSVGVNIGILVTLGSARTRAGKPSSMRAERWEGDRGARRVEFVADKLDLDPETRSAFLEQHREFFESVQSMRREIAETKEMLRREVGSPAPNLERIEELVARSARLSERMERAFVDNVLAVRQILDERQQEAYFELLRRGRDRGDRGRRRPAGEGPGPPN